MTEVVDRPATDAADASPNGEAKAKSKRNTLPIQIGVPLDLKEQIKAAADAANKTEARWVLENIAHDLNYTLPEAPVRGGRRGTGLAKIVSKDMTLEQKRERFDNAAFLLAALDAKKLDIDALKREMGMAT